MSRIRLMSALVLGAFMWSASALAVPQEFVHQGRLLDASGVPLDGAHSLSFSLYDAPSGGTLLWVENVSITADAGFYSVVLGTKTPFDATVFAGGELYLQMSVDGGPPLPVRQRLASVPFAMYAASAHTAENVDGGVVDATEIRVGGELIIDAAGNFYGVPQDPLEAIPCANGEILRFQGGSWGCDIEEALSPSDVLAIVETTRAVDLSAGSSVAGAPISTLTTSDIRGDLAASPVDLGASSTVSGSRIVTKWADIPDIPSDIADGDDTVTEEQVEEWISNGGINVAPGTNDRLGVGTTSPAVRLDVAGPIRFATTTATCDATIRGTMRYQAGGSGTGDTLEMCMKNAADAYRWVGVQRSGDWFSGSVLMSDSDQDLVNSWIGTPNQNWTLCYRKSTHGGNYSTFRGNCNNRGPTVTVARLSTGKVIGGYSAVSWQSVNTYVSNSSNFLFSLTNQFKHTTPGQHGSARIYDYFSYGPTWGGGHDLHINGALNGGYCNLGHDYTCRTGSYNSTTCRNDFCGDYSSWSINELEVWYRN